MYIKYIGRGRQPVSPISPLRKGSLASRPGNEIRRAATDDILKGRLPTDRTERFSDRDRSGRAPPQRRKNETLFGASAGLDRPALMSQINPLNVP